MIINTVELFHETKGAALFNDDSAGREEAQRLGYFEADDPSNDSDGELVTTGGKRGRKKKLDTQEG